MVCLPSPLVGPFRRTTVGMKLYVRRSEFEYCEREDIFAGGTVLA